MFRSFTADFQSISENRKGNIWMKIDHIGIYFPVFDMSTEHQKGEVRKIQFSGKSSYMLALPKKWVEEMGLGAGDSVAVERQGDSSLIVTPRVGRWRRGSLRP